ncbi:DUF3060 domain-containing protein [Streptomyces sp. PSKA54]|uniref:DUF3060 domain-containing protein n=1 Tax=Streptomyces himalayensis subsp. aureolus TaxID=2758039 RepID=A0A7W2D9A6_9ACTN|nr:DUF3060 domain-containing protein [Streptomyces himalayensis]MBA4867139.1 DUF3060 domain-containing protein [Streptomyces himalayensis subsp. aureolus]
MRISKLLPTTVIALALATTVGCSAEVAAPTTETTPPPAQTTEAADTGADAPSSSAPAPSDAKPLRFTDNAASHSADCTGRDVSIEANTGDMVLKGDCGTITVEGKTNSIVVESAESINIKGDTNEVAVRIVGAISVEGLTNSVYWVKAASGDQPEVNDAGDVNEVTQVKPAQYEELLETIQG